MHQTYYAKIMESMDMLPIISDGFNIIYFLMAILVLCLFTYFLLELEDRFFTVIGLQQFENDEDEITVDLSEEERELIKWEKRRRQRAEDNECPRRNVEVASSSSQAERIRETEGTKDQQPNATNPQGLTRKQRTNKRTARRKKEKRQRNALAKAASLVE